MPDDELFALLFGLDEEDDWTDPDMLRKANLNYGISFSAELLLARHQGPMANAREQGVYQTKHLNRWVGARLAFFDLPKWIADGRKIKLDDFVGRRVRLGLDLASTIDLNAVSILIRDGERYTTFSRFYLPEATVEREQNQHYRTWARQGRLIITPGGIVGLPRIRDDILALAAKFDLTEVGYDPFQTTMLVVGLMQAGIPCVEIRPTVLNFSAPIKHLDGLIRAGRLEHDGCLVMIWMIGNTVALANAKDNVYPRKEQNDSKIGGTVALLMARARDLAAPPPAPVSVYELLARMQVETPRRS